MHVALVSHATPSCGPGLPLHQQDPGGEQPAERDRAALRGKHLPPGVFQDERASPAQEQEARAPALGATGSGPAPAFLQGPHRPSFQLC